MNAAGCIKNELGLSDVDFEELSYSNSVFTYEYTSDGISYNSELIPIVHLNNLIGWIAKTAESIYQFSTALVDEVNEILVPHMSFVIIYDATASYLYDGTQLYLLDSFSESITGRSILNDVQDIESTPMNFHSIDTSYHLGYTTVNNNARYPTHYICSVPFVTQNPPSLNGQPSYLCWAACVASILSYLLDTTVSATNVAANWFNTYTLKDYNIGIAFDKMDDILAMYGITYTHRYQIPSDPTILYNIQNGYPIIGTFSWQINEVYSGSHAAVIYGIHVTGGFLFVMDPDIGFCTTTYVPSVGTVYYDVDNGLTMLLYESTCKYWTE